ncbi:MAG: UDP-glucose/GDP-mannose dehydrogenase family protein [Deltaproteobacteria bacterium]|nr:UDP-glucose/GDP-mannose dehydrogenase family protein [Deltaproteobacteria bacterium]
MNVCIVGTGYVGLVTAACFSEMGNQVACVDINPDIVEKLKQGELHIFEPGLEDLVVRNQAEKRLNFTSDLAFGMDGAEFVFNCVGTPPGPDGSCDLSAVYDVADQVARLLSDYTIIVNKSTVPVGTAARVREIVERVLAEQEKEIEFDVVSNPEFLKEGDAISDFMKPDRIIIGTDNPKAAALLGSLYSPFARSRGKLIVMSPKSAEMTKYAANSMLATKISFINEIANICERVGADIKDVRVGIGSDARIGYHFIYPGVGYGGSCFPKDVSALIQTSIENQYSPELLVSVDAVNNRQKVVVSEKVKRFFADMGGVQGKTLAVWGLSFKANTDDVRSSAAIDIIEDLTAEGMKIRAFDPAAGKKAAEIFSENRAVEISADQYAIIRDADALAIVTDWNQFRNPDFPRIKKDLKTPVIFDGRNLYSTETLSAYGFVAIRIGRPDVRP